MISGTLPNSRTYSWTPARVLVAALGVSLLFAVVDGSAGTRIALVRSLIAVAVYLLASAGSWSAAREFAGGDHLRRPWALFCLANLVLAFGRVLMAHDLAGLPAGASLDRVIAAATLLANAFGVTGMVLIAMTWRQTGLPLPGSPGKHVAVAALLSAATLLAVGPDLVRMAAQAMQGDSLSLSLAIADICDAAVFLLSVPVFLTARAFSGGSLAWPFALLAASNFSWLLVDGFATYGTLVGTTVEVSAVVGGLLRNLACLLLAAAGVAQRLVLRGSPAK
jgi:hypothetical protein